MRIKYSVPITLLLALSLLLAGITPRRPEIEDDGLAFEGRQRNQRSVLLIAERGQHERGCKLSRERVGRITALPAAR